MCYDRGGLSASSCLAAPHGEEGMVTTASVIPLAAMVGWEQQLCV